MPNKSIDKRYQLTYEYTVITHAHPRSILANILYLEIIVEIVWHGLSIVEAIDKLPEKISEYLLVAPELESELPNFEFLFAEHGKLQETSVNQINSDGYVVHTLNAAVWCVENSYDFSSVIMRAVELGEDTDTTATVVGALYGAMTGIDEVPSEWLETILKRKMVESLLEGLVNSYKE